MKRRILFALLVVSIFMVGMAAVVTAPQADSNQFMKSRGFKVEVDGVLLANVLSVEQVGLSVDSIEYQSGDDNIVRALPGVGRPNNVIITGFLTRDTSMENWIREVYNGKDIRKDITVTILNPKGEGLRTFDLIDCFPTRYEILDMDSGPSGEVMKWTLEVRVNRIEMA